MGDADGRQGDAAQDFVSGEVTKMIADRPSPKYAWRDFLRPQERKAVAALSQRRQEAKAALAAIAVEMDIIRQRATIRVKYQRQKQARAGQ